MEITEITRLRSRLRRVARRERWTEPSAPSTRAQAVLVLSAFLLGAVLSALVFVGVWRHTAAAGDRAQAAQAIARHNLVATQAQLTALKHRLLHSRTLLATTRAEHAAAAGQLTRLHQAGAQLPGQLQAIDESAAALAHTISTLQSELSALQSYVDSAKTNGIDAGFVSAQVRYLTASTRSAQANVARVDRNARAAITVATAFNGGK